MSKTEEKPKEYNPKYWRLVGRYWHNHYRFVKSGGVGRYHFYETLRRFGSRTARQITENDISTWLREQQKNGVAVNTINNRFQLMKAVFKYANKESDVRYRLNYDPTERLKRLEGGNVRQFVLTPEKFERNYEYFKEKSPGFAVYYLALWETGRRPLEVSQYTWDYVKDIVIKGRRVRYFDVPASIVKCKVNDQVMISDRLWEEMSRLAIPQQGWVFKNAFGNRWTNWENHMLKLNKAFGVDAGWARDTRRGFVTRKALIEGYSPSKIMAVTGHRTMSMFQRYCIAQFQDKMDVVFGESPENVQISAQG
jgi:integrase